MSPKLDRRGSSSEDFQAVWTQAMPALRSVHPHILDDSDRLRQRTETFPARLVVNPPRPALKTNGRGLFEAAWRAHNTNMTRNTFQISIGALLVLVACSAVNIWLFRVGVLWGILGLNVSKHLVIAYLCQTLGVNRRQGQGEVIAREPPAPHVAATGPPYN